ncbi:MAG: hypothetical protein KAT68_16075 [Bacteroidales bacterium]|nr:hypothetical protein [Bacteroidales bacterium]
MEELNLDHPINLFKNNNEFYQIEYALQWKDRKSKNSEWTIYKFELLSGNASGFVESIGWKEYINTVDSLNNIGISQDMIMFGDLHSKSDSTRLGLQKSSINNDIKNK